MSFGNLVKPWTKHVRTGRPLVRRAFDTANEMGDLTFAAYSCNNLITNLLASGEPLPDIQREAEAGLAFARKIRFGLVIDIITSQLRLILTLRGLTPAFNSFNDAQFDEGRFEQHFEADPRLALPSCWYWIRKLQARFHAGDYEAAIEAELQAQRLLWTSPSFFEVAEYRFYAALARAAYCHATSAEQRLSTGSAGRTSSATRDLGASLSRELRQPHGVGQRRDRPHRRAAPRRRASLRGVHPLGARARVSSITKASPANSPRVSTRHAVSNTVAQAYLRNARYCYLRWGADGKVRQLDESLPAPAGGTAPTSSDDHDRSPDRTPGSRDRHQSLPSGLGRDRAGKLIDTLMRTALEHAGAQRGLLIVPHGGAPAARGGSHDQRRHHHRPLPPSERLSGELPESVLHYVVRTQESVILDDASAQNAFSADEYIRRNRVRSVLCLPLIKQTTLIGVLYLENNLAPGCSRLRAAPC
jgi:hypothetical protein